MSGRDNIEEPLNARQRQSINDFKELFTDYENNTPTLEEALYQMFISSNFEERKSKNLAQKIVKNCQDKINEIYRYNNKYNHFLESLKITKEEACIICSYTYESEEEKDFLPYKILNKSLLSEDKRHGLEKISKYFYILLKALRKLPKYYMDSTNKYLYRCIKKRIKEEINGYHSGGINIFFSFTSTTMNQRTSNDFLNRVNGDNNKSGTIFVLEGDIWGYNITIFNYFGEVEILLEPETKFIVNYIYPVNDLTFINCKVIESHNVLPEIENTVYDYIQNNNISNPNNNIIPNIINRNPINRIREIREPRVRERERVRVRERDRNNNNINAMRVNPNFNVRERNSENKELRSNNFSQIGFQIINGDILGNNNYKLNKYFPVKNRILYKSPTSNNFKKNLIYLMQNGYERKLAENALFKAKGELNHAIQILSK